MLSALSSYRGCVSIKPKTRDIILTCVISKNFKAVSASKAIQEA
jgi:hypothetical protein